MAKNVESLTGLPNRVSLQEAVKQQIAVETPVALALVDVDNFMEVNESFGHDMGDKVLQTLAQLLSETAPGQAYRISGDEFAVLMPDSTLEAAFLRMEGVRQQVHLAAEQFGVPDGRGITVTIGVAQYPRDAKDEQGLMKAADAAVMTAKENGRNQVALPPNEEMVMKSCYYSTGSLRKLKALAEKKKRKESQLLREALDDLLRKYDGR